MPQGKSLHTRSKRMQRLSTCMLVLMALTLFFSACGTPSTQPQAEKSKVAFNKQVEHAKTIGVPDSMLQPILSQAGELGQSNAPLTFLSDQPAKDHYNNLAQRYDMLKLQVSNLENKAAEQLKYQATQNMMDFEQILSQRKAQGFVQAETFSTMYNEYQNSLKKATLPKDFEQVKNKAWDGAESMRLLGTAFDKLTVLESVSTQFKNSKIDTTAVDQQRQSSIDLLRAATTSTQFSQIIKQLDAHLQSTTTISMQAAPIVGSAKLQQLSDAIENMKKYEGDTTTFQQRLDANRTALSNAKTLKEYMDFSSQIDKDLAEIRVPLVQSEARFRVKEYLNAVTAWRNSHVWHNPYDGKDYNLGHEYDALPGGIYGAGSNVNDALTYAEDTGTVDEYQSSIDYTKNMMANFQAMQENFNDTTPWDQPHNADKKLLEHYKVTGGMSMVVSLSEQAIRVYQDGRVVRAIQIVTGKYERPTPPGFWTVWNKRSPSKFTSIDPKGSPEYFEPIDLKYAILFTVWEHYFHDAHWRTTFGNGPGYRVNLPHDEIDPSARNGSHGCVNMREDDAAWVFQNAAYSTPVIIY